MVRRKLMRGLLALVSLGVVLPSMVMRFTVGMKGSSDVNMRSLGVITDRVNARMRVRKRIPHYQERNKKDGKQSIQVKTSGAFCSQV